MTPAPNRPAPSRAVKIAGLIVAGIAAVVITVGIATSGADEPPAEDRSTTAGVQCEEAVAAKAPGAELTTTRTERGDGAGAYEVGGTIADGRTYSCKLTDNGDGTWTLVDLRIA